MVCNIINNDEMTNEVIRYPHFDNNPSFSDFKPFGGFTEPYIKQYMGVTDMCNTNVDLDYMP